MKFCWARALLFLVVAVLGTSAMLTACGQKGPLYHPGDKEKAKKYDKKQSTAPKIKE